MGAFSCRSDAELLRRAQRRHTLWVHSVCCCIVRGGVVFSVDTGVESSQRNGDGFNLPVDRRWAR